MQQETTRPGFVRVLLALAQVAFHDNAVKLVLIGLATAVLAEKQAANVISLLALLLVLPFVLFGPLAGWLSDHFAKDRIFRWALVAQVLITVWVLVAVKAGALAWAVGGFFLLGLQSTFFSPAKRGIIKELVGSQKLAAATGASESLVVLAILIGTVAGGKVFDVQTAELGDAWQGASTALGYFLAGCVVVWLLVWGVKGAPAADPSPFRVSLLWGHFVQVRGLYRQRGLFKAALGESAFYFLGGAVMVSITQLVREKFSGALGSASETGFLMALMGVGIIMGSLVAAAVCRRALRLGLVPLGGLGMTVALGVMAANTHEAMPFSAALILLGVSGGMFLVPVSAYLQDRAEEQERGNILAATNLLSSLAGMLAVGLQYLLGPVWGLPVGFQLVVYAFLAALMSAYLLRLLPDEVLRLAGLALARVIYPTRIVGLENIPAKGGVLIVCNHVSYADTLPLAVSCSRPIRFLSLDSLFKIPAVGTILRIFGCIPVSPLRAKEALQRAAEALKAGEVVCIFPEGQLTRTGTLMELKPGFELIARRAGCPVVVANLDGLWGSVFSFSGGRYFFKWPRRLRVPITVSFSRPLAPEEATTARVRREMLEIGAEAFAQRAEVRMSLGRALLHQMKARPWETQLIDFSRDDQGRAFSRGHLLASALALGGLWKKNLGGRRIGVVLPPGEAGTVANLALIFAGKIPVNLNPTSGTTAVEHALRSGEVSVVVTASPVRRKLTKFPWPEGTLDLAEEAAKLGGVDKLRAFFLAWVLPYPVLKHWLELPAAGGDDEAALLFTSGSSGLPKGVPLSHANLMGNAVQIRDIDLLLKKDRLLSALPLFHSFGLTVGLLAPLLGRRVLVTVPSPLESDKIGAAGRCARATLLLGTPTFLRQWMKRLEPSDFPAIRLAITGAEKLPAALAAAFAEKFGAPVLEGYGLTETSPVAAFNLPDPFEGPGARSEQKGNRAGSVGRLLPGLAARLLDPLTEQPVDEGSGVLAFRGANVLRGYLGGVEAGKFRDGWFVSGDLARFDADGFLFIEGRLSRFSKVGGEMVPHLAVEEAIQKAFPPEGDKIPDCVLGLPDGEKGEQLVVLSTRDLDPVKLRESLAASGLPNLWVPKRVIRVEVIPVLGSGKLDFGGCKLMAERQV